MISVQIFRNYVLIYLYLFFVFSQVDSWRDRTLNKKELGRFLKIDKETPGRSRLTKKAESFPNNNVFSPVFSSNFSFGFIGFPVFPFPANTWTYLRAIFILAWHLASCGYQTFGRSVLAEPKCAGGRAPRATQWARSAACSRPLDAAPNLRRARTPGWGLKQYLSFGFWISV